MTQACLNNIENTSKLLSLYLDRHVIGTPEEVDNRRKILLTEEWIHNNGQRKKSFLYGNTAEGINLPDINTDIMIVDNHVVVMYPGPRVVSADKTVFYIKETECLQPESVALQRVKTGRKCSTVLQNSFVQLEGVQFLSSDIFQEQILSKHKDMGLPSESETLHKVNFAHCFHCDSWPRPAEAWVSRTRLNGWPSQTLINNIVRKGCHIVPTKVENLNGKPPQWKISLASAERDLVYSFSHVQFKVYWLLKYFFVEIKEALTNNIPDVNFISSDLLKSVIFFTIENSHQNIWHDHNLFSCFWICINTLVTYVKAGYLPHYFIPNINMFKDKLTRRHQKRLFHILNYFRKNKLLCLSFGKNFQPTLSERLCGVNVWQEITSPESSIEKEYKYDTSVMSGSVTVSSYRPTTLTSAMNLFMKTEAEVTAAIAYGYIVRSVSLIAQHDFKRHTSSCVSSKPVSLTSSCASNKPGRHTSSCASNMPDSHTSSCASNKPGRHTSSCASNMFDSHTSSCVSSKPVSHTSSCASDKSGRHTSSCLSNKPDSHTSSCVSNKALYKATRKSKYQIAICASMGTCTEVLYLATFYFLTGNFSRSLELCEEVRSQPSYFAAGFSSLPPKQKSSYLNEYCGKGYTLTDKLKRAMSKPISFVKEGIFLPQLQPEVEKCPMGVFIPPLPYAIFLSFLCSHELGDIHGCRAALHIFIMTKYDDLQGAHRHWIVHNLLGVCYQTLGDHDRAERAYKDSAKTKTVYHEFNPVLERIEGLQGSDRAERISDSQ
ncbi:uncharacterized protein [Argopecten irradians]|uniref:uncharacterized protein n=1 Tax=Argopecten irradians TaxID=31199 RepID=UPI0037119851